MTIKNFSQKLNIALFVGIFCVSASFAGAAERSLAVDAKVNISLCVSDGKLKINGWERREIRAFVSGGSEIGFKVLQKSKQNNNAVWVMVVGFDPAKKQKPNVQECLNGEDIEIDVPRGATVNIKNYESETNVSSIAKVVIENASGDIFLNDIERGVEATTYEGDVTVEKSGGAISLSSTTGNIIAFDLAPSEIGDIFKAKSNSGTITVQNIEHHQVDINSNSGSMKYTGEFQNGGQYKFGTSNGAILLAIPENSSCKILASYGYGVFNSELPLGNVLKSPNSKTQSLTALMGAGDATLSLTTYSGAIRIRKK